jgi:hypothetical protein
MNTETSMFFIVFVHNCQYVFYEHRNITYIPCSHGSITSLFFSGSLTWAVRKPHVAGQGESVSELEMRLPSRAEWPASEECEWLREADSPGNHANQPGREPALLDRWLEIHGSNLPLRWSEMAHVQRHGRSRRKVLGRRAHVADSRINKRYGGRNGRGTRATRPRSYRLKPGTKSGPSVRGITCLASPASCGSCFAWFSSSKILISLLWGRNRCACCYYILMRDDARRSAGG